MSLSGLYPLSERGLPVRTIISIVVVAVLLPTLIVTGWVASVSAEAERAQIDRNIEQQAREISAILDREMIGIKSMLTALATSSSLHNGNLQGFHGKSSEISQQLDLQIGLYDNARSSHLLNTAVPFGASLTGYSFPRPLIEQIIGTKAPIVTGVTLSPILNRYGVAIILPVRPTEDLDYLIAASVDAAKIAKVFDLARLRLPYVATVVDRDGMIVARSSKHDDFVGKGVPQRRIAPAPGTHGVLEAPNVEGTDFRWFHHKSVVTEWTVLVGAPQEVFETSFKFVSKLLAGAALALFAGGLMIAYRIGEGFSRAVSELGTVARELPRQPPPQTVSSNIREANRLLDDLKAASTDLRATGAEQRFAIEGAGIGTWSWDIVRKRLIWSRRTRELYGLSADAEPTIDHVMNSIHPADRAAIRQNLRRCFAGIDSYDIEFRVLGANGKPDRWLNGKGRVERDSHGAPVFMHGAVQDITERKTNEQERAELRRRLAHAQEEERLRLARELHDQTGQSLTAALLEVKRIETVVGKEGLSRLACLRAQLEDMGKSVHRIARELRPTALDDINLRTALANHLAEWGATYGIRADFHFHCGCDEGATPDRLSGEVKTAIYRIAQEALTNVARHARGARVVSLVVNCCDELVQMTIEDDGCGFDPAACSERSGHSGLGLAGMRERAALIGGSLEIESSPQVGTTIFVRVPLEKRRQVA